MRDGGIDLRMSREGRTYIVECKCYDRFHRAGRPVAQKLQGANAVERAGRMVVVTTSTFSPRTRSTRGPGGRRAHRRRLITMCRRAWGDTLPPSIQPGRAVALSVDDLLTGFPADGPASWRSPPVRLAAPAPHPHDDGQAGGQEDRRDPERRGAQVRESRDR